MEPAGEPILWAIWQQGDLGLPTRQFPAKWKQFHKAAGSIRNREMLKFMRDYPDPDKVVLAFHEDLESSTGTKDMVEIAGKAGFEVRVFKE